MKKTALSLVFAASLIVSCNSAKVNPTEVLTASSWEVSMLNGKPASESSFGRGVPTATFTKDNKISGFAGCNRYGGSYSIEENGTFKTDQVFATKMYCDGVEGEGQYLSALDKADKAKVEKDKVILLNGNTELVVLVPASGKE